MRLTISILNNPVDNFNSFFIWGHFKIDEAALFPGKLTWQVNFHRN